MHDKSKLLLFYFFFTLPSQNGPWVPKGPGPRGAPGQGALGAPLQGTLARLGAQGPLGPWDPLGLGPWPTHVFSKFASTCFFSICPVLFYQLLPNSISIMGQAGAKNPYFISCPVEEREELDVVGLAGLG